MKINYWAAVISFSVVLASCGVSDEEVARREQDAADKARIEATDKAARAAAAAEDAEGAKQRAEQARTDGILVLASTIKSKLDPTGNVNSSNDTAVAQRWEVVFGKLDGLRWEWTEQEEAAAAANNGGYAEAYDRLTYTVDPRDLSAIVDLTTYSNMPAVRISCRSTDCIHVTGVSGRPSGNVAVDEYRDDNNFPTPTQSDARAVASAMRELINLANQ